IFPSVAIAPGSSFEIISSYQEVAMSMETFLVRTMSDTVETDIQRVLTIANEILPRYEMPPLSLTELRKIADGPFDLFLIPLIFAKEYQKDSSLTFNDVKWIEIRNKVIEIASKTC